MIKSIKIITLRKYFFFILIKLENNDRLDFFKPDPRNFLIIFNEEKTKNYLKNSSYNFTQYFKNPNYNLSYLFPYQFYYKLQDNYTRLSNEELEVLIILKKI